MLTWNDSFMFCKKTMLDKKDKTQFYKAWTIYETYCELKKLQNDLELSAEEHKLNLADCLDVAWYFAKIGNPGVCSVVIGLAKRYALECGISLDENELETMEMFAEKKYIEKLTENAKEEIAERDYLRLDLTINSLKLVLGVDKESNVIDSIGADKGYIFYLLEKAQKEADACSTHFLSTIREAERFASIINLDISAEVKRIKRAGYERLIQHHLDNARESALSKWVEECDEELKMAKKYADMLGLDISKKVKLIKKQCTSQQEDTEDEKPCTTQHFLPYFSSITFCQCAH